MTATKAVMTGKQFRRVRKQMRMSQERLAHAMGFANLATIWKLENGSNPVTIQHYRLLTLVSLNEAIKQNKPALTTPLGRSIVKACQLKKR